MTVLKLVQSFDPILKETMPEFDFETQKFLALGIAKDLAETMISHKGLGLAANQIGLRYRVFAMTGNPVMVCFNPKIIDTSETTVELEEGCLTFPGLFIKVTRPVGIRLRFTMPNGETDTVVFGGMTSRIVQHEIDHLNGVLFTDYVSKTKLDILKRKARKQTL